MASSSCKNCGAHIDGNMKFCRRCGHPSSVLEAPRPTLDETFDTEGPTRRIVQGTTTPGYIVPGETANKPTPNTKKMKPAGRNQIIAILGVLIFLVAVVATLVLTSVFKNSTAPSTSPPASSPAGSPEDNDSGGETGGIVDSLVYPGAEITLETSHRHGRSLQLHSKDSPEKVADWYIAKVKPKNIVRGGSKNIVLSGSGTNVVINPSGDGTNIIVNQKDGKQVEDETNQ